MKIEAMLEQEIPLAASQDIGRARRVEDARGRYIHAVKSSFPADLRLDGLKIVVDCANGAAYQVAPSAFWELGAEVVAIGVTPNGININDRCGSTSPQLLQESVVSAGADRSEEHTSELQSLMRISYAVFCLKKKNRTIKLNPRTTKQ